MSSRVTRPITSPYSSTTRAKWVFLARKALSWSRSDIVSGTNQVSSDRLHPQLRGVAAYRVERAQQVLGVEHADDVLLRSAPERQPRIGRRQHLAHDLFGGRSALMVRILVRWTITRTP